MNNFDTSSLKGVVGDKRLTLRVFAPFKAESCRVDGDDVSAIIEIGNPHPASANVVSAVEAAGLEVSSFGNGKKSDVGYPTLQVYGRPSAMGAALSVMQGAADYVVVPEMESNLTNAGKIIQEYRTQNPLSVLATARSAARPVGLL